MSRYLSELLGAPEPAFMQAIREFESATDKRGVDIRMANELQQAAAGKLRELGLDPRDSTGEEIYTALQDLVAKHDDFLNRALHVGHPDDLADILRKVSSKVKQLKLTRSAWVLKPVAAKRLLKAQPPRKVMKQLGYRSLESMLKRESVTELFAGIRVLESPEWLERLVKSYRRLTPQDFETRTIDVVVLDEAKWGKGLQEYVSRRRANVTHLKEIGVVALLPLPKVRLKGVSLTVMLMTLHYIDEIRAYSTYFKFRQVQPDFAAILVRTILHDPSDAAMVVGRPIHWKAIRRHFGKKDTEHPEVFQPHVQPEDLWWRRAESAMTHIEPALSFWDGMDHVGLIKDGHLISLNLLDNVTSYCNGLGYGQQLIHHFQANLWHELLVMYLGDKQLERQIIAQLEGEIVEPDLIPMTEEVFSI